MRDGKVVVLHVITRLIGGGADENTISTVEGLSSNYGSYICYLAAGSESDRSVVNRLGKNIRFFTLPNLRRDVSPIHDTLALFSLMRLCRAVQCDILHTHTAKAGFLGRIAGALVGVPIIVHGLHGHTFHPSVPRPTRFVYYQLEKLAARFTSKFISVSSILQNDYIAAGVARSDKCVTIRSGMRLEKYSAMPASNSKLRHELGILSDDRVVGTICRLAPDKGPSYFLEMAKLVKNLLPHCKFVVVGEGPLRKKLEDLRDQMGLAEDVIFSGYRTDAAELLGMFDVFVLTSLWEGLPRALVQAAVAEKPLVAFEVGGIPEVIQHGYSGYLVRPKNTKEMAQRVVYLLKRPNIAATMGKNGRSLVGKEWSVSNMVSQIHGVYESLLASTFPSIKKAS